MNQADDFVALAAVAQAAKLEYGRVWRDAVRGALPAQRGPWGWKVPGFAARAYIRQVEFDRETARQIAEARAAQLETAGGAGRGDS